MDVVDFGWEGGYNFLLAFKYIVSLLRVTIYRSNPKTNLRSISDPSSGLFGTIAKKK